MVCPEHYSSTNSVVNCHLFTIEDRAIITHNSANILNIMAETTALNPEEEVIRKRGRKKTPKVSQLPLRRSPRKSANPSAEVVRPIFADSQSSTQSDPSHDYFLRTPKKTPQKSSTARTPSKQSPSKSVISIRRVSPRKRLLLDNNDSGLGLSPALSSSESTPVMSSSEKKSSVPKAKTSSKSLTLSRRRRRRYF